jgi:hypothetical protein
MTPFALFHCLIEDYHHKNAKGEFPTSPSTGNFSRSRGKIGGRSGHVHNKLPGPEVETEKQAPLRRLNDV